MSLVCSSKNSNKHELTEAMINYRILPVFFIEEKTEQNWIKQTGAKNPRTVLIAAYFSDLKSEY